MKTSEAAVVRICERILVERVLDCVDDRIWEHELGEKGGKFDREFRRFASGLLREFKRAVRNTSQALRRKLRRRRRRPPGAMR